LLGALAVYVEQARQEEKNNTDPSRSLSTDIWHIQVRGDKIMYIAFKPSIRA
jgi:hypothetical protein